ncbi:MAG: hypothetical protein MJ087_04035 [Lachnospiraceae bacterium]|nr:hypothetical protein [Lachnospiraceae bacterium]
MKKQMVTFALAAVLACSLCACGGSDGKDAKKEETKQETAAKDEAKQEVKYVATKQEITYEGGTNDGITVTYDYTYNDKGVQMSMKQSAVDKDGKALSEGYGNSDYELKEEKGAYKMYPAGSKEATATYTYDEEGRRSTVESTDSNGNPTTTKYEYQDNGKLDKVVTKDKDGNEVKVLTYDNADEYETNFLCKTEYDGQVEREYKKKYDAENGVVTYILTKGQQDYYAYQVVFILHGDKGVDTVEQYDKDGNILSKSTSKWDEKIGHIVESYMENNKGMKSTTVTTWEELK